MSHLPGQNANYFLGLLFAIQVRFLTASFTPIPSCRSVHSSYKIESH